MESKTNTESKNDTEFKDTEFKNTDDENLVPKFSDTERELMGLEIFVDYREQKKIKLEMFNHLLRNNKKFNGLGISVKYLQMTISDFAICYNGHVLALIERKTLRDLAQTIKDSSRKFNYEKMLNEMANQQYCLGVYYLIEGPRIINRETKYGRIQAGALITHLDHLMFEKNIHVLYSANPSDSVYRILELTKNIVNLHENLLKKIDNTEVKGGERNVETTLTTKKKLDDNSVIVSMWSSIKGVSPTIAGMLMNENLSIRNMILGEYKIKQIQAMRYPSGRIIGGKASKLINKFTSLINNLESATKFLSSIPSVSKKSAGIILESVPLRDILHLTEKDNAIIADVKFTEKRKIGKAIASKVIKYLGKNITL